MSSLVLLIISLFILTPSVSQSRVRCQGVFRVEMQEIRIRQMMQPTWDLYRAFEELDLFGSSKKKRAKERATMKKEIKGVEEAFLIAMKDKPHLHETLDMFQQFNKHWAERLEEYKKLPKEEQARLKESIEVPLSIGIKHFVAFLEARNHRRWKLGRLHYLLELHTKHLNVDLETALFLINRGANKFFSRWDFVNCRY